MRDIDDRLRDFDENCKKEPFGFIVIYRANGSGREERAWTSLAETLPDYDTAHARAKELIDKGIGFDWEIRREADGSLVNNMRQEALPPGWSGEPKT